MLKPPGCLESRVSNTSLEVKLIRIIIEEVAGDLLLGWIMSSLWVCAIVN